MELTENERKNILKEIELIERKRIEKFKQKLNENGWMVSLKDAKILLEIAEEFLENEK